MHGGVSLNVIVENQQLDGTGGVSFLAWGGLVIEC